MIEATTPEETVATFALVGLGLVLIIFFLRWVLAGPAKRSSIRICQGLSIAPKPFP
jgi:hypothetical protein